MKQVIDRRTAQLQGLKRFYTGKPCKAGHDSERYVKNGGCVQCINWSVAEQKRQGSALNMCSATFVFQTQPVPTQTEMQAALRYVQENLWHDAALVALRNDPALMAQYVTPPTPAEVEAARALLASIEATAVRKAKAPWGTPEDIAAHNARLQQK